MLNPDFGFGHYTNTCTLAYATLGGDLRGDLAEYMMPDAFLVASAFGTNTGHRLHDTDKLVRQMRFISGSLMWNTRGVTYLNTRFNYRV